MTNNRRKVKKMRKRGRRIGRIREEVRRTESRHEESGKVKGGKW